MQVHIHCGKCCDHHHRKRRKIRARVTLAVGAVAVTFTPKGKFMFSLPDDKTAAGTVAYVDAKGNPAVVDGAPVWSSSDESIITLAAAPDGMSAVVTPVGPLGTAQIKITADADMGAGVVEVVTIGDVEVIAGQAVAGNLSLSVNP